MLCGADRLLAGVRESPVNARAVWSSLVPRLLPVQVTEKDERPFKVPSHGLIGPAQEPEDTLKRRAAASGQADVTSMRAAASRAVQGATSMRRQPCLSFGRQAPRHIHQDGGTLAI
ncbi:MAG: hypothetical protein ACXIU8_02005 [Alkalilacustris sp.]